MLVGFAIAALFISLLGLIGGIILFSLLPILLAVTALAALVVALLVVTVMVLPNFITLDDLKPDILALVKQETGREITIGGPISVTLWPVLGLQLRDISISNPPGFPDPIMLSARELSVGVTLSSLLERNLDLRELRLTGGQINLSVNENGEGNWLLHAATDPNNPQEEVPVATGDSLRMHGIAIGRIEVRDTNLGYDFANGQGLDLLGIDVTFTMPNLTRPARLTGDATYNGQTVKVRLDVANPAALLEGTATPLTFEMTQDDNTLHLAGNLSRTALTDGVLRATLKDLPDVIALTGLTGVSLPAKILTLDSQLAATRNSLSLDNLRLTLDDLSITGKTALNGSHLSGNYDIGPLNLDPWFGETKPQRPRMTRLVPDDDSVTDIGPFTHFTADMTVHLAGLTAHGVPVGATTAKVRLQGARLDIGMTPATLYGGTIDGSFGLDRRSFALSLTGEKVDMGPLVTRLTGRDRLTGRGSFSLNLRGPARGALLPALNGDGRFLLQDGALKGVNIPALVRQAKGVLAGNTKAFEDSGPLQTDFTELSGTYRIVKGIISNDDLKMLSPLLRITGRGTASLPADVVDYRADTALVADLAGQGGLLQRRGLVIPILISGPFNDLHYAPDLQGLMVNTLSNIPDIREQPRQGVEGLLRGLFGK